MNTQNPKGYIVLVSHGGAKPLKAAYVYNPDDLKATVNRMLKGIYLDHVELNDRGECLSLMDSFSVQIKPADEVIMNKEPDKPSFMGADFGKEEPARPTVFFTMEFLSKWLKEPCHQEKCIWWFLYTREHPEVLNRDWEAMTERVKEENKCNGYSPE